MTERRIGIVFYGATGDLARRQHLPSLVAIRDEGGLALVDGSRLVPDVVLVGRDAGKLAQVAGETGFTRTTTDLGEAPGSDTETLFFDAAPSGLRVQAVRRAIDAGKDVYCEKPVAGSGTDAVALHAAARAVGIKAETVQDKLFLPGFQAMLGLRRDGFFGRLLELRVEMGRWVFDGFERPGQRPSWNYRKRDGGGLILDMFPHWRYMIDALGGEVRAVSATARTQILRRRDERGAEYQVDVEDAVFAQLELEGGVIASVNNSWCTRVRRDFAIQVQIDGTLGSAVAGPHSCWTQAADAAPGGAISAATPQVASFFDDWTEVKLPEAPLNSYRAGWELFLRHVTEDAPFPFSLLQGAKGVQLAEAAYLSNRERRWVEVLPLA